MKKSLKIEQIIKKGNRIDYCYEANEDWKKLLNLNELMFVEYDQNVENVPDSIAIIPLLCNILPISWIFDLTIVVESLDKAFLDCIDDVKQGYANMYPSIKMLGNIVVNNIEENKCNSKRSGALFSGGVDAFNTLIQHIDEHPILLTVWGSDIKLDDVDGWNIVNNLNIKTAKQFNLDYLTIKTNFRTFINYKALSSYVSKFVNGEWWHEFQHGIGLIGLTAPLTYTNKISTIYIASSYTNKDKGNYTCASDPTIDNYLKFSDCKVVHDGYDFNRQDKIHNICTYVNNNSGSIELRVCWESLGGKNCCECEKCYRTMLGILTEKKDPNKFGFELDGKKRRRMMKKLPKYVKYNLNQQYGEMQKHFIENYSLLNTPKDLMWFRNIKIKNKKPKYVIVYEKIILILKKIIKKVMRTINLF